MCIYIQILLCCLLAIVATMADSTDLVLKVEVNEDVLEPFTVNHKLLVLSRAYRIAL